MNIFYGGNAIRANVDNRYLFSIGEMPAFYISIEFI